MSLLPLHDPPGFVEDLRQENRQGWSKIISAFMHTRRVNPTTTPHFYDATREPEQAPIVPALVTWLGFPRQVALQYPNDRRRWTVADGDRQVQDEYLEWSVKRNAENKITKIVFCNEGPEYFEYLAQRQPDTLVQLYQNLHPGVEIRREDILVNGVYNPQNKWNSGTETGTIMHLIQRNNTLSAQVDLGGRATILRVREDGQPIIDRDELVRCSDFGNANRNSDPTIGAAINAFAREGHKLTIANPVGLYIDSVDWAPVHPPAGHDDDDPQEFWKWTRGRSGHFVRGEFEVPPGKGYVVGDMFVRNVPLEFGGQLADLIKISIRARVAGPPDIVPAEPRRCGDHPIFPGPLELEALEETHDCKWLCDYDHDRAHS
ncbi:hypothetical protein D9757_011157 [Collybiopsis confluens]|uniref:Uncharacterized protein n=1 Tax=Collybiopsis confluens TaxID=2823264 RepID=A0A8H5M2Q1_9AGAR|nr:hypothetical protein D9757_011157 [Collybiopsis confluens]